MDKDRRITLLMKYAQVWAKIDEISQKTSDILATSAMGQAPPCFHALMDKQQAIINEKATPIWEELKNFIMPEKAGKIQTYWQKTRWFSGTMPPSFEELGEGRASVFIASHTKRKAAGRKPAPIPCGVPARNLEVV